MDIPRQQMKLQEVGLGYDQLSCYPTGSCGYPLTTQAIAKIINCSPQIDGKAPLLKTTLEHLTEHGEIDLGSYREPLPLCLSIFDQGRYSAKYRKRHRNAQLVTNSFIYNVLPARQWWHTACLDNSPISDLRSTQQDENKICQCLCNQKYETRQPRTQGKTKCSCFKALKKQL